MQEAVGEGGVAKDEGWVRGLQAKMNWCGGGVGVGAREEDRGGDLEEKRKERRASHEVLSVGNGSEVRLRSAGRV